MSTRPELWQDREIKFDVDKYQIKERPGEKLLAYFDPVEDTKGNNGQRGFLRLTNLRMIWEAHKAYRVNLSIGFKNIINVTQKTVQSKLRGNIHALHVLAKGASSRFEFIFTCVESKQVTGLNHAQRDMRMIDVFNKILAAYRCSEVYRELKLRTPLFEGKQLAVVKEEKIYSEISGVWNLSSEQGNLGKFILTSIRIIWYAETNMLFNVSLPWVQIENIKIRESKFGKALVIVSSSSSSKYTLGFRIDPEEKLRSAGKEIIQLLKAHSSQPELGVFEEIATKTDIPISFDEDVAVEKTKTDSSLLYALEQNSEPSEPILDPSCGLLVEKMPPGVTLKSLWAL